MTFTAFLEAIRLYCKPHNLFPRLVSLRPIISSAFLNAYFFLTSITATVCLTLTHIRCFT